MVTFCSSVAKDQNCASRAKHRNTAQPMVTTSLFSKEVSAPVPIPEAAARLGVKQSRVRAWIRRGAPTVKLGTKGRGHCTLIDITAIAAWRQSELGERAIIEFAGALPELLADAAYHAFLLTDGPSRRDCAGALAAGWYLSATTLLDTLRQIAPTVPDVTEHPEKIVRLRRIFDDGRTVSRTDAEDF